MPSLDNLTVTVTDDDSLAIAADGQIDSHTSSLLEDALAAVAADRSVSVDLAEVSFVDSSGLRVLVRDHKRRTEAGSVLTIVSPSEPVRRLLEMTGLSSQLTITP